MSSDPSTMGARRSIRIGKYDVIAHVATGGMGAVYRAMDVELGREVALKVLPPEIAIKPAMLERFRREARSAAKLRHENIVTLFEFGEANGTYFLAMEFVDGIDLHDYVTGKGPLDAEESVSILKQAARALEHAHQQGIVHRDIKPSNFLLTRKEGQLVVKLTDMGLAREASDEESRVTRDGTTVGTVDYMSPEQSRDSRSADIRSDIYSLGCTWYHILSGSAPFPEGSMAERIYKHIEADPPDIREFNPNIPDGLAAILQRMLAKQPDDRYQTPAELLEDLERGGPVPLPTDDTSSDAEVPAGSDEDEADRKARRKARRAAAQRRVRQRQDTVTGTVRTLAVITQPRRGLWIAGAVVALAVVLGVSILIMESIRSGKQQTKNPQVASPVHPDLDKRPDPEPIKNPEPTPQIPLEPVKPVLPALYKPSEPIDTAQLRQEIEAPWAKEPVPGPDTPILRVGRFPTAGAGPYYDSLTAACAAAPAKRLTIIEIHDNGPVFELPVAVTERSILLRAGKGYRPLLAWDLSKIKRDDGKPATDWPSCFLSVTRGSLTLEKISILLKWTDKAVSERTCLARVTDGNFLARDCTFSVSGRHAGGVAVIRMEATPPDVGEEKAASKCRLSRCFARGANLVALDVRSPRTEILLDGCLLVGGDQPLLQIQGHPAPATNIRVVRSTLVAGQTLLQMRSAGEVQPALNWFGWDALLARCAEGTGGELVDFGKLPVSSTVRWRAVNCLYTGWKTLLAGPESIPATALEIWRDRWHLPEGESVDSACWPDNSLHDPAEDTPDVYRAEDTRVGFAASSGPGALGCDLAALPWMRDGWLALTYERFIAPPLNVLEAGGPAPEITPETPELYHGGRLDLAKIGDLGAYLQKIQQQKKLGDRVVLSLFSTGERTVETTPIRVRGRTLVIYFEPPIATFPDNPLPPLALLPTGKSAATESALIEVEDGNLEIQGGEIRYPDFKLALVPPYLIQVRGGDLRIQGCKLQGPLAQVPDAYRGLVRFEGSGEPAPDRARGCAINESILISGRTGIHVVGTGARLRLQQCAVVTGGNAIHLEPKVDPATTARVRLNVQCFLDHNTVAAREALLEIEDAPSVSLPAEPVIVQTKANVFMNPFAAAETAGVLLYGGEALSRGLLVWQGDGDAYDKRLSYFVRPAAGPRPEQKQLPAVWTRLWGRPGVRQPIWDWPLKSTLDLETPQLDRLALPANPRVTPPYPGADLGQLGIVKKPKSPKLP